MMTTAAALLGGVPLMLGAGTGRRNPPAARLCDGGRAARQPGAHAVHDARDLHLSRPAVGLSDRAHLQQAGRAEARSISDCCRVAVCGIRAAGADLAILAMPSRITFRLLRPAKSAALWAIEATRAQVGCARMSSIAVRQPAMTAPPVEGQILQFRRRLPVSRKGRQPIADPLRHLEDEEDRRRMQQNLAAAVVIVLLIIVSGSG